MSDRGERAKASSATGASARRFVVMGAGELGFHLARTLHQRGHDIVLIDIDPDRRQRIEAELDLTFLAGNGTDIPILEQAGVASAEMFIAASSSEEANLVSSVLAKDLGAKRCAVRLETTEELTTFRARYERLFHADLLLSPHVLATTEVLNLVLGHNTHEIDYLARGQIQLRTIQVQPGCELGEKTLRRAPMPKGARIVAYFDDNHEPITPRPDQTAPEGCKALVLSTEDRIREVEKLFSATLFHPEMVAIAGAGKLGMAIAEALLSEIPTVKLLERDRAKARRAANRLPKAQVLHLDATDGLALHAERINQADAFVAATGHDENNLMAGLVAQEIGVEKVVALVKRTETNLLWQRAGSIHTISPRYLAAERISDYIQTGYKANMIVLEGGALQVIQRRIFAASPVVGASLAEIDTPYGLLVGAVVRGERVFVPDGDERLRAGDLVILFVHRRELSTVRLFFPGPDEVS